MSKTIGSLVGISADPSSVRSTSVLPSDTLIGVEIELENMPNVYDHRDALTYWKLVEDGSLRNNGVEFVFKQPFGGMDIVKACVELERFIRDNGFTPDLSDRTSVHIHLDVRDLSSDQLKRLMVLYTVFERVLFKFAGPERFHNIFALPIERAQGAMPQLAGIYKCDKMFRVHVDKSHKYSAFNLKSLNQYGSVEFRHHKGNWKSGRTIKWISIIQCLKIAAIDAIDAFDIHQQISNNGPSKYLQKVFGKYAKFLMYDDVETDIMEGVRLSQDIVYDERMSEQDNAKASIENDLLSKFCEHNKIEREREFSAAEIAKIYRINIDSAQRALRDGVNWEAIREMYDIRVAQDPEFNLDGVE